MSGRNNPRFKSLEREFRTHLTSGLPAVIRLDGRAFHSYCRDLARPYDEQFMADMDATMIALAQQIDGVRLAYVQSDEISLLLTDHYVRPDGERVEQGFMFGGGIQKLVSISAAIASTTLNMRRYGKASNRIALFDSRAFSVTDMDEARDYFVWRQEDAEVNSLSMLASAHFSHKQLHGVPNGNRAVMLHGAGIDPDALPLGFQRGRIVAFEPQEQTSTFVDRRTNTERTVTFTRQVATAVPAPVFAEGLPHA